MEFDNTRSTIMELQIELKSCIKIKRKIHIKIIEKIKFIRTKILMLSNKKMRLQFLKFPKLIIQSKNTRPSKIKLISASVVHITY